MTRREVRASGLEVVDWSHARYRREWCTDVCSAWGNAAPGRRMWRVRTLGGLSVERDGKRAAGAAAQPRRLALLAMIARAGTKGLSRDRLLATLWPDAVDDTGRQALKQSLYALRRDLDAGEIFLGTHEVRLNEELVRSDVHEFEEAARRGALEPAAACYEGPFLDGFRLTAVPEFEYWMEEERRAVDATFAHVLERLATAARGGHDHGSLVRWLKRRAALEPLNARVTVELMQALLAAGDRTAALQQARIYEALVTQALDLPPDPSVRALVESIREGRITAAAGVPHVEAAQDQVATGARPPSVVARPAEERSRALALVVSPFAIIPDAPSAHAFRDALREEMLSAFGARSALRVFARSDTDAASHPSSATAVVEGALRVAGSSVRVTARLLRGPGAAIVWTARFDVALTDDLAALESLALSIADGATRALLDDAGLPTGPSAREQADALYTRGMQAWTPQGAGLGQGLDDFRAAIAIDPTHARSHAALAESYTQLAFYGFLPARRAATLVDGASREAMRLAPDLAESHLARGTSLLWVDRDFDEGARALEHALALDPTLAVARARLAFVHLCHEGPREWERSNALRAATTVGAPGLSRIMYGQQFLAAERYDEAIEALLLAIDSESPSFLAYHWLSAAYAGKGMASEALAAAVAEASLSGHHAWSFASLITASALAGQQRRAVAQLETLRARAVSGYVQPTVLALAHAAVGDTEAGMRNLELAVEERDPSTIMVRNFPMFAPFRAHPRFRALLREAGWNDWDTAEFRTP